MLADEHHFIVASGDRIETTPRYQNRKYENSSLGEATRSNRLVLKTEGSFSEEGDYENQTELLWFSCSAMHSGMTQVGLTGGQQTKKAISRQWACSGHSRLEAPSGLKALIKLLLYVGSGGQTELVL